MPFFPRSVEFPPERCSSRYAGFLFVTYLMPAMRGLDSTKSPETTTNSPMLMVLARNRLYHHPADMVCVNNIDVNELQAEALRTIDADKYAEQRSTSSRSSGSGSLPVRCRDNNGYASIRLAPDGVYSGNNTNKQGVISATVPQPLAITRSSRLFGLIEVIQKAPARDCSPGVTHGAICLACKIQTASASALPFPYITIAHQ